MLLPSSVFQGTNPTAFPFPISYPSCYPHSSPPGDGHSALTWLIKDDTKLVSNIALVSSTRLIAAARGSGSCRNRTLFTAADFGSSLELWSRVMDAHPLWHRHHTRATSGWSLEKKRESRRERQAGLPGLAWGGTEYLYQLRI